MSNKKNNGGPAFPVNHELICNTTLRDYFAAKALQGMMSNESMYGKHPINALAQTSYAVADAMLKAREHFPSYAE